MKLEGGIGIAAPARRVWDVVVDPVTLASCVPGVRDVRQVDERTFEGAISAQVGPMQGDFSFTSVLVRADYPDLVVEVSGVDSVTKSRLETHVDATIVEDAPDRTTLRYRADVRIKGRLAILGEMLLRATASLMIGQVSQCLRSRLETGAGDGAGSSPGASA